MKKYNLILMVGLFVGIFFTSAQLLGHNPKPPRLTVVLVVDQMAHAYFDKIGPHFKHGLRYLVEHGVVYTNAHQDNGQPGTATGHANLSTGVGADYHGFVSNNYYENGKKVACDDDFSGNALVIDPVTGGTYDYGKSAERLMVDGLSDQCVLQSRPSSKFTAYSISGKSRSAIPMACRLGKAVWFDTASGLFTSSKAYFNELPEWLQNFNSESTINQQASITWRQMYPESPYAYSFFDINNYKYTRTKTTMLNKPLLVQDMSKPTNKYHLFERTPQANQYILDCAYACIKAHVSRKHRDRLMLWVCLSPLDKVVHQHGPNSMEAIDMLYHLDKQIQRFMRHTLRVIGKHETIFALTADHAIMPIPELLHEQGLTQAHRIQRTPLIESINKKIAEKHGFKNVVTAYKSQEFILDQSVIEDMTAEERSVVIADIRLHALQEKGIRNVWAYDDLVHMPTQPGTLEDNIKRQLYKGRSGSLIVQTQPYTVITNWGEGASHTTPYNYDTHVPMIVFHPGKFERRYVRSRVSARQLPNTLAEVLNVPKPSASVCEILPELFDPEYQ